MDHSLQRHYFVKIKSLDVAKLDSRRFEWWNAFSFDGRTYFWCGRLKGRRGRRGDLFLYQITRPIYMALMLVSDDKDRIIAEARGEGNYKK